MNISIYEKGLAEGRIEGVQKNSKYLIDYSEHPDLGQEPNPNRGPQSKERPSCSLSNIFDIDFLFSKWMEDQSAIDSDGIAQRKELSEQWWRRLFYKDRFVYIPSKELCERGPSLVCF